jgi:quercetin dioxygenase-like cupin family protein
MVAMAQERAVPSDQDPMHKTVFKNDYVIVLRVTLAEGQSTGWHTHSRDAMAVRLSNAKTKMQNLGQDTSQIVDHYPGEVSANDYANGALTHKVSNAGNTVFDVFDVEAFKKFDGPHGNAIGPTAAENATMRAYKYELAPGQSSPQHTHERPYLIIAATPMDLKMTGADGKTMEHPLKTGDLHWIDQRVTHTLSNNGSEKGVIVEIEWK